jgi:hypothetical protein
MLIQSNAEILLEQDEPIPVIRQFVKLLRDCAIDTDRAEIELNLVTSSARGQAAVQEFRPQRTKGMSFAAALAVTEELTTLSTAKIKSLHFMLIAQGFRWKGSREDSKARLALLDGKSFQRKKRFSFYGIVSFDADSAEEPFIGAMLARIEQESKLRFNLKASQMILDRNEPGRATQEELFVTALVWNQLGEDVGKKVRDSIPLDGDPHLMTSPQAMNFIFDPKKMGNSVRVDFTRIAKRWLKQEFGEYSPTGNEFGADVFLKKVTPDVFVGFSIDKRNRAFSKEFTIVLFAGLTSPRFAPAADRPLYLSLNLFRLFGFAPLPLQWTYETPADLEEALASAAKLLKQVLAIFAPEMTRLQNVNRRRLEEFEGPRNVSARQASELALPPAREWAADASLIRMTGTSVIALTFPMKPPAEPAIDGNGRLNMSGGWWLQFHSRSKQENLYVTIPCYGPVTQTKLDAPAGRHYPSDVDQILRDGWMDSGEAMHAAWAAAREKFPNASGGEPQQFELSSRQTVHAAKMFGRPLRDGMFEMHAAWRISFS